MAESGRTRAFTLADVLVVGFLCLFLMAVMPPVFSKIRSPAFPMTCGTNLSGIGKAMLIYANDYEDQLPRAGGRTTQWGATADWKAADRRTAFGLQADGNGGAASIGSCFYLLVKYSEITPKSFICKGDKGATEFKLHGQKDVPRDFELIDAWDFGPPQESFTHCSYSYHIPFGLYALTTSGEPGFAVAADRNPWIKSPAGGPRVFADFRPDAGVKGGTGTSDQAKKGNAVAHQNDGQNVLFLDSHVEFAKRVYCSVEDDNIYTISQNPTGGDPLGLPPPTDSTCAPANRRDSVLVNDFAAQPRVRRPR